MRESCCLHRHPREAGIPQGGAGQYVVVTCTNQRGDSRAERENDVRDLRMRVIALEEPTGGFFGRRWLPLNDVHKCKCDAGYGGNVDAEARVFRHSEAAGRGIPQSGAGRYVVATLTQPQRGDSRAERENDSRI